MDPVQIEIGDQDIRQTLADKEMIILQLKAMIRKLREEDDKNQSLIKSFREENAMLKADIQKLQKSKEKGNGPV